MKQTNFFSILLAILMFTSCANRSEASSALSDNISESSLRMWTDSQSARKTEVVPYSKEFSEEISEEATEFYMPLMKECEENGQNPDGSPQMDIKIGGRDNHLYTGNLETYLRADGDIPLHLCNCIHGRWKYLVFGVLGIVYLKVDNLVNYSVL